MHGMYMFVHFVTDQFAKSVCPGKEGDMLCHFHVPELTGELFSVEYLYLQSGYTPSLQKRMSWTRRLPRGLVIL